MEGGVHMLYTFEPTPCVQLSLHVGRVELRSQRVIRQETGGGSIQE